MSWIINFFKTLNIRQGLFFLLIFSALLGPGLSYKSFYFFHLILGLNLSYLILAKRQDFLNNLKDVFSKKRWINFFFLFLLLVFLIQIPFAESTLYALKHFVFLTLGITVIILILAQTRKKSDYKFLFQSLSIVFIFDLFIGLLEALTLVRWPISRLSSVNNYFGRRNELNEILSQTVHHDYVNSMPTSFHWNPNNFATFILLGLPFFMLAKNKLVSFLGQALIITLVIASGSKSALLGGIIIFICSLLIIKRKLFSVLTLFFLIAFYSSNGFGSFSGSSFKLDEFQSFVYGGLGVDLPVKHIADINEGSNGYRKELIEKGLGIFLDNPFGVGGGNAQFNIEKTGGVGKQHVTSLHNFWLELLVEGGIILFLVFILFLSKVSIDYVKAIKEKIRTNTFPYFETATLLAMLGFIFSGIGPSSLIGFLPLYVFLGLVLSLYHLINNTAE